MPYCLPSFDAAAAERHFSSSTGQSVSLTTGRLPAFALHPGRGARVVHEDGDAVLRPAHVGLDLRTDLGGVLERGNRLPGELLVAAAVRQHDRARRTRRAWAARSPSSSASGPRRVGLLLRIVRLRSARSRPRRRPPRRRRRLPAGCVARRPATPRRLRSPARPSRLAGATALRGHLDRLLHCGSLGSWRSARVRSMTSRRRSVSARKRFGLSSSAWRRTSGAMLGGSWSPRGISAPSTRIGMSRTSRSSAASISSRTKSSGSSSRRDPSGSGDVEPLLADQGEQDVARPDRVGDRLDEVVAELDGVDVLEDLIRPEPLGEAVVEPARGVRRVLPAVADEDPAGRFGR